MRKFSIIAVITELFFVAFVAKSQISPFLTNGLVAYYPFNGTANDAWGTNDGTIEGETVWTNGIFGGNSALFFDGETRVIVQDSPSLDPTNAITLAAWFSASVWSGNPRLISKGEYNFGVQSGSLEFDIPIAGATYDAQVETALPSMGNWHFAVATYDGTLQKIYIDGKMLISAQTNGSIAISNPGGTALLNIGAKPSQPTDCCPTAYFDGAISDVAIYNRSLSSSEVSELYYSFATGIITVPTITIAGNTNQSYSVQYVNNLSSTNWITLASNIVLRSSPYYYPDTNSVGQPQRFYRVVASE